jgi:catechol 2,3-dioxygenase-like lactoylglutathione lyase family enzyme
MNQHLSLVSLVVADYDEAIAFFTRALNFELCEDTPLGGGKRWVVVRPPRPLANGPIYGGGNRSEALHVGRLGRTPTEATLLRRP